MVSSSNNEQYGSNSPYGTYGMVSPFYPYRSANPWPVSYVTAAPEPTKSTVTAPSAATAHHSPHYYHNSAFTQRPNGYGQVWTGDPIGCYVNGMQFAHGNCPRCSYTHARGLQDNMPYSYPVFAAPFNQGPPVPIGPTEQDWRRSPPQSPQQQSPSPSVSPRPTPPPSPLQHRRPSLVTTFVPLSPPQSVPTQAPVFNTLRALRNPMFVPKSTSLPKRPPCLTHPSQRPGCPPPPPPQSPLPVTTGAASVAPTPLQMPTKPVVTTAATAKEGRLSYAAVASRNVSLLPPKPLPILQPKPQPVVSGADSVDNTSGTKSGGECRLPQRVNRRERYRRAVNSM